MPLPLDPTLNEPWEPSEGYTLVDPGIYPASIFAVHRKSNAKGNYYEVVFRINGGPFDGEDIVERYVGLQKDSIFRLYDILAAANILAPYYDAANKRWIALPTDQELIGQRVLISVDVDEFHAQDKTTKQPLFLADGVTPKILQSNKIGRYFNANEPAPEYRPSRRTPAAPATANAGAGVGGYPGAQGGAYPGVPTQTPSGAPGAPNTDATPW